MTGSSSHSANSAIANDFNTNVLPRVTFIYQANVQISIVREKSNNLTTTIKSIETDQVNPIKSSITILQSSVGNFSTIINATQLALDRVLNNLPLVDTATAEFLDLVVAELKNVLKKALNEIIDSVLLNNPVKGFAECKNMAESLVYDKDLFCNVVVDSFSGLWFLSMLLAIIFIPACIIGVRTKKRVHHLQTRNKIGVKDKPANVIKTADLA